MRPLYVGFIVLALLIKVRLLCDLAKRCGPSRDKNKSTADSKSSHGLSSQMRCFKVSKFHLGLETQKRFPTMKPSIIPFIRTKNASWKTLFSHNSDDLKDIEFVSIHYGRFGPSTNNRLLFFNGLFLIPFITSLVMLFLQDIFSAYSRDISNAFTGVDFKFGVFFFAFRVDDVDFQPGLLTYGTDWTLMSYHSYCRFVQFSTRVSTGDMIDRNFFCKQNIWSLVEICSGLAVACGVIFVILLFDNILVWQGHSHWFNPTKNSDTSVRKVRRFFKIGLMVAIFGHFVFQVIALSLMTYTLKASLIVIPHGVAPYFGFYGGWASVVLDVVFLAFFNYSDQLVFFHVAAAEIHQTRHKHSNI